jgi:hypothetical protein
MKKFAFLFFGIAVLSLNAQDFFNDYKNDANTYLEYYTAPVFETNLFNFSDGWSHSAKTLKPWKFSLEITADYTFIPEEKQKFVFNPDEYEYVEILDANDNPVLGSVELPTFFGGKSAYKIKINTPTGVPNTYEQAVFDVPQGVKEEFEDAVDFMKIGMPGAMVQVRVGLPLSSEITLRYFPDKNFSGVSVGLFGIGLKHDVGKYMIKNEKIHLAGLISYAGGRIFVENPNSSDLSGEFVINTYNLQVFGSYDWKFFSVYGSVGVTQGSSRLRLLGELTYDYDIVDDLGNVIGTQSETIKDPLDLKHSLFVPKSSVGILLNLKVLHIFAQYNLQKYQGLHAGISINL